MSADFWDYLQQMVETSQIVIDRAKGSNHPRFAGRAYPVDYGYLKGTTSIDLGGVDIWKGSLDLHQVVGALLTVDLLKRDTELKIIIDCDVDEIQSILNFVNSDKMRAIFIKRDK